MVFFNTCFWILLGYAYVGPVWFDTAEQYTAYRTPDRPAGVPRQQLESMEAISGLSWPRPPPSPPPRMLPPEGHPQVRPPLPEGL